MINKQYGTRIIVSEARLIAALARLLRDFSMPCAKVSWHRLVSTGGWLVGEPDEATAVGSAAMLLKLHIEAKPERGH